MLAANGHAPHKGEMVQAALNLAHSIKILAGNLPCRVVSSSSPLPPSAVPCICIEMLQAGGGAGAKGSKVKKTPARTPSKTAAVQAKDAPKSGTLENRKRRAVEEEEEAEAASAGEEDADGSGGEEGEEEEAVTNETSAKKKRHKTQTPAATPGKGAATGAR